MLPARRFDALDRLRGLAITLMVLDHALAVAGQGVWCRLTLTRAALPLFMLVMGVLRARSNPKPPRMAQLFAAALVASTLAHPVPGLDALDVLFLILGVQLIWPLVRRWPLAVVVVGAVEGFTFKAAYPGYTLGHVAALAACGVLLAEHPVRLAAFVRLGDLLPATLAVIGRRPLLWYLGHLAALAALWSLYGPH